MYWLRESPASRWLFRRNRARCCSGLRPAGIGGYTPIVVILGQLSSTTHSGATGTVASFGYTRDANGQLTSTTATGVTQGNESYPYTQLNQLAGVNAATYSHDAADNLTAATSAGATTTYTNDATGNRATTTPPAGEQASYTYDQESRLTAYVSCARDSAARAAGGRASSHSRDGRSRGRQHSRGSAGPGRGDLGQRDCARRTARPGPVTHRAASGDEILVLIDPEQSTSEVMALFLTRPPVG
jgi:YD repeat-containing protein